MILAEPPSVFGLLQTGSELQDFVASPVRKLLQDSAICGFNEYFCGDADLISDTAYQAVTAGNCFHDTLDTGRCGMAFPDAFTS